MSAKVVHLGIRPVAVGGPKVVEAGMVPPWADAVVAVHGVMTADEARKVYAAAQDKTPRPEPIAEGLTPDEIATRQAQFAAWAAAEEARMRVRTVATREVTT